jgi:GNAT superfamily N-acetyltransferase
VVNESSVRFEPASALSPAELTALWNRAYESYFVPLVFTEAILSHHLRRAGVELDRSLVGRIEGDLFGLSLAAIRGERAWIGGFGVAVAHRRKGLASRMIDEHMMRLDLAGIAETSLEVMSQNPAREVYRAAGFAERGGPLLVLGGTPRPVSAATGVELDLPTLQEAHQRIAHRAPMTWRRDLPTLEDDLRHGAQAFGVVRDGAVAAFAVVQDMAAQTTLLDAAAADVAAGHALLDAMANRRPGRMLRLVDEPDDSPLAQALEEAGFSVAVTQVEMVRPRGGRPAASEETAGA